MRFERFMALTNIQADRYTSVLLLHLGSEPFSTARYLGVVDITEYKEARKRLMHHYSPPEEPVELRSRFQCRIQADEESIENFARDIRILAARAFPKAPQDMRETLMVQQFIDGLRDGETKKRLILKKCDMLQDALNAARLSEIANKAVLEQRTASIFSVDDEAPKQHGGASRLEI